MRVAGVLIAVALALAMQTTLDRLVVGGTAAVDLVLVAVVYVALTMGPVTGMLTGSVAGLIQDALSSDVIGVGGLAKTVVGFLAGAIGQQFIVTAAVPRLVMFVAATGDARRPVHGALPGAGRALVRRRRWPPSPRSRWATPSSAWWRSRWSRACRGCWNAAVCRAGPGCKLDNVV